MLTCLPKCTSYLKSRSSCYLFCKKLSILRALLRGLTELSYLLSLLFSHHQLWEDFQFAKGGSWRAGGILLFLGRICSIGKKLTSTISYRAQTVMCILVSSYFNSCPCCQGSLDCELPPKQKTDICTIMYTSGTTGEPKGVVLSNEAIMAEVLSTDQLLLETDKVVRDQKPFLFLKLNDSKPNFWSFNYDTLSTCCFSNITCLTWYSLCT